MSHWVREERVTNGPSHIRSPVSCITGHSGLPLGNRSLPGTPEHSRPAGGLGRLRGQWAEGLLGQGHWGSGPPPGRAGPLPEAQPATVGAPGQDSHKPWIFGSGAERARQEETVVTPNFPTPAPTAPQAARAGAPRSQHSSLALPPSPPPAPCPLLIPPGLPLASHSPARHQPPQTPPGPRGPPQPQRPQKPLLVLRTALPPAPALHR